jgi:2-keto-4-pentenoate hydratase
MTTETRAEALLKAWDTGGPIAARGLGAPFPLAEGYDIADRIKAARLARGERIAGRKIGFTNRRIWPLYGVDGPIWGWIYDTTLHTIPADGAIPVPKQALPRIEPEIAFHFRTAPRAGMSVAEIAGCIDWLCHGIEIVTSPYPDWRFSAADSVAAQGLHAAFWAGPHVPMAKIGAAALESFTLTLTGAGERHAGQAGDVLDGPLHALRFLMDEIAQRPGTPAIGAGEVITTGTLTDARPVAPGQSWRTELDGIALPGVDVTFR